MRTLLTQGSCRSGCDKKNWRYLFFATRYRLFLSIDKKLSTFLYHTSALPRRSRLPPRSVLGAPHRGAAPEAAAETKSFCPCHKTGENTGFLPGFFLHVVHGNGVRFGSNSGFSHPVLPVLNRFHPLQHPKRTRLRLFSPEIGCVSLFLSSFDLQNFQLCFCASCRIVVTG